MDAGDIVNGKYEIVGLLGAGGMGSVYKARAADTGAFVALKVINSGDLAKNPVLVARFEREVKAASAIEAPHIVQVVDAGLDDASGMPFMAMELLLGEDTQQLIDRLSVVPPPLALAITAQACIGLQKAHEAKVVHRDIKPANLFLSAAAAGVSAEPTVVVKLLDFGVAKVKMDHANNAEMAGLTRTGSMLGSPLYMSPEQARGHKTIDHRADIWSLGVVLYQMLSGRTPHHDIDALGELIIAICSDPPRSVQDFAPWVAPEVAAVVHRALRFDPGHRYQSASAMLEAIAALLPSGFEIRATALTNLPPEARRVIADRLSPSEIEGGAVVPRAQVAPTPVAPAPPAASPAMVARAVEPKPGAASPTPIARAPGDPYAPAPLLARRSVAPPPQGAPEALATGAPASGLGPPASAPRSTLSLAIIAGVVTVLVLSLITLVRVFASGAPIWPLPPAEPDTVSPAERPQGPKPPSGAVKNEEPH